MESSSRTKGKREIETERYTHRQHTDRGMGQRRDIQDIRRREVSSRDHVSSGDSSADIRTHSTVRCVPDFLRLSVVADADDGTAGRLDDLRGER